MKKIITLACLASLFAFPCLQGGSAAYTGFNSAKGSEDAEPITSFLDAAGITYAAEEAEPDITDFPAKYDLRSSGIISDIKSQGKYGTCWAIAASDSVEAQVKRNGYEEHPDLSEWQLAYFTYKGTKPFLSTAENVYDSGGTNTIAAASLARWQGFAKESKIPYDSGKPDSSLQFLSDYKVTDVYNVHSLMSNHVKHSENFLKELIYSQNAVAATYYSRADFYNEKTSSQYCPDGSLGIDHAVILLGWDDSYPKENFRSGIRPSSDGAWLAKNSWGTEWGNKGYFWISYEDKTLSEAGCYFAVPGNTYSTNYQYDETGWCVSISADANQKKLTGYMSNVFTAENNDPVTAVSFYTTEDDAEYEISVYKDVRTTGTSRPSPVNGTLVSSASGSQKYTGYHTVILDTPVNVKKGDVFSVSVKLTNHTSPYVIPMEASSAITNAGFFSTRTYQFHTYASQESDPSYISLDGNTWYVTTGKSYSYTYPKFLDLTTPLKNLRSVVLGNVCVKALASPAGTVPSVPASPAPPASSEPAVSEPAVSEPAVSATVTGKPAVTEAPATTPASVPVTTQAPAPPVTTAASVTDAVIPPVTTAAVTTVSEPPSVTDAPDAPPLSEDIFDIDRDGKVSASDLVLMIKILHGAETKDYASDLDGNSKTDILDLILLKERLTGNEYNIK